MIKAIGFKVIIKPKEIKKYSAGGIELALDERMEKRAQDIGTIVQFGEDFAKDYNPTTKYWGLKPGDQVYYAKYAGKWIDDPDTGEELLVLHDEDICAIYIPKGEVSDSSVVAS